METRQTMFSPRLHALWDKNYRKIKQKYWENGEKTLKNNWEKTETNENENLNMYKSSHDDIIDNVTKSVTSYVAFHRF